MENHNFQWEIQYLQMVDFAIVTLVSLPECSLFLDPKG